MRSWEDIEFCYESTICNITKSSLAVLHANLVFEHHVCVKRFSTVKMHISEYSFGLHLLKLQGVFLCEIYSGHKSYQSNLEIDD